VSPKKKKAPKKNLDPIEEEKEKIKPPKNHDFKKTPIYKQFVLK
jgi:hypothetical protein|tara:strand:+ start:351 stop:482 length:132 start_codon:yes stop_codon:yes gene_type:complete